MGAKEAAWSRRSRHPVADGPGAGYRPVLPMDYGVTGSTIGPGGFELMVVGEETPFNEIEMG
jgi:hypothetical protein